MKSLGIFISLIVITLYGTSCHETTYVQGQRIYNYICANCHMEDGSGLVKINPPLANSDYLRDHQSEIPCIIRNGQHDSIIVNGVLYYQEMIAFPKLSAVEITNVVNYINHAWGNDYGERTIIEVNTWLKACSKE